jgi:hypothetical protein
MSLMDSKNLVELVGIDTRTVSVLDLLTLAGRIIHDPLIRQRKAAMVSGTGNGVLPHDADEQIIRSMPANERAALRARIQL